jgi:uncharacterized OB-fold protein
MSGLRCTKPRLEAALEPGLLGPCPGCGDAVFAPGYWCDDCGSCAFPTMLLESDFEPEDHG